MIYPQTATRPAGCLSVNGTDALSALIASCALPTCRHNPAPAPVWRRKKGAVPHLPTLPATSKWSQPSCESKIGGAGNKEGESLVNTICHHLSIHGRFHSSLHIRPCGKSFSCPFDPLGLLIDFTAYHAGRREYGRTDKGTAAMPCSIVVRLMYFGFVDYQEH